MSQKWLCRGQKVLTLQQVPVTEVESSTFKHLNSNGILKTSLLEANQIDPIFDKMSYQGVPDLRIITLLGFPVMAMVRQPTRMSDGKANLHQGAIGVGIKLATGTTFGGVWKEDPIDFHPDTPKPHRRLPSALLG